MILYKPYLHLAQIRSANTYRLSVLLLIPDGFDIKLPSAKTLPVDGVALMRLELISVYGQVHSAPREYLMYLKVPRVNAIKVQLESKIALQELPGAMNPFANFAEPENTDPFVLGKSLAATAGVEIIDDPREGVEKDKSSNLKD
ncbi:MAG: hypothetical protein H6559_24970 [Lewinellaceae bacterium]|nr:hypothetical protein [Lewinellaceae bacterium]